MNTSRHSNPAERHALMRLSYRNWYPTRLDQWVNRGFTSWQCRRNRGRRSCENAYESRRPSDSTFHSPPACRSPTARQSPRRYLCTGSIAHESDLSRHTTDCQPTVAPRVPIFRCVAECSGWITGTSSVIVVWKSGRFHGDFCDQAASGEEDGNGHTDCSFAKFR
jgi:hypothetical protein